MSFAEFLANVANPALREIATHWNEARGESRLPAWADLKPAAFAQHLPIVWAWRLDPVSGALVGRLAGSEISHAHGGYLRGQSDTEFFASRGGDKIVQRQRHVVTEPCFYRGVGAVFSHTGRSGHGERIVMPTGENHIDADGIFGATVYRFELPPPDGPFRDDVDREAVTFFPLD